jgi:hypothetical protein
MRFLAAVALVAPWLALAGEGVVAQPPPEVQGLVFHGPATLGWNVEPGADAYAVYRGSVAELAAGVPGRCHGYPLGSTTFDSPVDPPPGGAYFYVVTAESDLEGEGTPGDASGPVERALLGRCRAVMRNHVLDRTGFGTDPWTRSRIDALGFAGYIAEQLDPSSILDDPVYLVRAAQYEPPLDIFGLIGRQTLGAVYSRRQLEWQVAIFWANHFNTFWGKITDIFQSVYPPCVSPGVPAQCDADFPARAYAVASELQYREMNRYRDLTFGDGDFRDLIEANALSPAMILYLDTYTAAAGNPNENYPRELLELYAMGVDGGYTQQDVEELARVFTGWTICKKETASLDDPLAPCIQQYWLDTPAGAWVPHFIPGNHDCTAKTLFAETPQELVVPATCDSPSAGVDDAGAALDGIVAHPATARFISKKLLQQFVVEEPSSALVDDVVAVWNDPGNPSGVGDLHAVLAAVLNHPALLDPDNVKNKIKTPLEHFTSAMRAVGGYTLDGVTTVLTFLVNAQHIPHYNEVPTGYSELGGDWVGTNNYLERQNYGLALALIDDGMFGSDPISLLTHSGVSTAPGNADEIVDFLAEVLFAGALTPAERQAAVDYLETDDNGLPSPYNDGRIRQTVGFLLGYPRFQQQ